MEASLKRHNEQGIMAGEEFAKIIVTEDQQVRIIMQDGSVIYESTLEVAGYLLLWLERK